MSLNVNREYLKHYKTPEVLELYDILADKIHINPAICVNLKVLNFSNNELKIIESNTLKGLVNLELLDLSYNQIETIASDAFKDLSNLKQLMLNSNKLKRIESNDFNGLRTVRNLFLNENRIEAINSSAFSVFSSLRWLRLDKNSLNNEFKKDCFLKNLNTMEIRLIEIHENKFGFDAVSYFKAKNDSKTNNYFDYQNFTSEIINRLDNKGGYLSDYNEFLEQFSDAPKLAVKQTLSNVPPQRLSGLNVKSATRQIEQKENERLRKELEQLKDQLEQEKKKNSEGSSSKPTTSRNQHSFVSNVDSFNRYERIKSLGVGGFGFVYLVKDKRIKLEDEFYKAMKMIEIKNDKSRDENEYILHLKISHQNIVKYFDHFDYEDKDEYRDYICIITEYCEKGDFERMLYQINKGQMNRFTDNQILDWITQATDALRYLHKIEIIHRDIKPGNLLLTKHDILKLADLGLSKYVSKTTGKTYGGTKKYMSPEQFKGYREDDEESIDNYQTHNYTTDVWSLGCVLYEMKNLDFAFPNGQKNNPDLPDLKKSGIFKSVLEKMLEKDKDKRISSRRLYADLVKLAGDNDY